MSKTADEMFEEMGYKRDPCMGKVVYYQTGQDEAENEITIDQYAEYVYATRDGMRVPLGFDEVRATAKLLDEMEDAGCAD